MMVDMSCVHACAIRLALHGGPPSTRVSPTPWDIVRVDVACDKHDEGTTMTVVDVGNPRCAEADPRGKVVVRSKLRVQGQA